MKKIKINIINEIGLYHTFIIHFTYAAFNWYPFLNSNKNILIGPYP